MTKTARTVLILGSAPNVLAARDLPKSLFSSIVAINNAWNVREDWDYHISPDDFPDIRKPDRLRAGQSLIGANDYVPANNAYGGIVYAGATMAFTAGYWVLAALRPSAMVFVGCDMVYSGTGNPHFYGKGTADPLRNDITLRNLEAKSARLMLHASQQGCACVRAPGGESRLVFPPMALEDLGQIDMPRIRANPTAFNRAQSYEDSLGYFVESGRYWDAAPNYSTDHLDAIDQLWINAGDSADAQMQPSA
ncbi:hypothetical protein [uncultured Tateyamaria sp.]|uniref:hypothetical protein n=1 Tax=uncultured Tateyamaria sp. TaxID=455651 RepID=UPI00261BBFB4|nr:hypothetical protein [uncultured Tateyamaria sp.]